MYSKLKDIREKRGITQADMAELLGYNHKSGYNKLENGERKISLEQAKTISDFFNLTIEDIFFDNLVNKMSTK
ncbi:helix-turn-helix transcriptional regulator [Clostridium sp. BJN0001]|uniref:helix-turn-helix transcriptional regulator n=1 Tax=Clostridium sp. BJN0001 TaxID=2930219 RepID=UPI001FD3CBE4|nr:helix-turn-helix transcriptional regulator [Clostridium sp. BJN0001]